MRSKKIFFDKDKTVYVIVRLFKKKEEMQKYYKKICPRDGNHEYTLGVNIARTYFKLKGKKKIFIPMTGEVLLNLEHCGASVVCHEFMHAVLWARKFSPKKRQYPIVIKDMQEEESMLHCFSHIIRQFYKWYWKIKSKV